MNRLMFAGTASSSGKTTVSCGFMKVLVNRGQKVASFKCGPDYIDPMFHEQIVGTRAGNLDGFFLNHRQLREMFLKNSAGCDITVLEGVMGCYDGIGFTREASSYEVAAATGTPIVLVVKVRGMAASMVALVRGFIEEDRLGLIRGILLNQMPPKLFPAAKREIEAIRPGLTCYGYVPVNRALELKSRHLGLVTPEEVKNMEEKVALAAKQLEETVDVDGLIRLAGEAGDFADLYGEKKGLFTDSNEERRDDFTESSGEKKDNFTDLNGRRGDNFTESSGEKKDNYTETNEEKTGNSVDSNGKKKEDFAKTEITVSESKGKGGRNLKGGKTARVRIAVARDRVFSFLYRDNLNWLAEHGAEPVFFSPLEDESIPEGCQGLILPGGYPELYLESLEKNKSMRASARHAIEGGMPTIAECGGFLYLLDLVERPDSGENRRSSGESLRTPRKVCETTEGNLRSPGKVCETTEGNLRSPGKVCETTERNLRSPGKVCEMTEGNLRGLEKACDSFEEKFCDSEKILEPTGGIFRRQEEVQRLPDRNFYGLAGVIHQKATNSHRLGRFGYIYLTAQTDGLLAAAGETIRAHEFHHYTTEDDGHGFRADKASGTGSWETGYHTETMYAGFPHIYFPGNEKAGERFLAACVRE